MLQGGVIFPNSHPFERLFVFLYFISYDSFLNLFTFLAVVSSPERFTQAGVVSSTIHAHAVVLAWLLETEVRN